MDKKVNIVGSGSPVLRLALEKLREIAATGQMTYYYETGGLQVSEPNSSMEGESYKLIDIEFKAMEHRALSSLGLSRLAISQSTEDLVSHTEMAEKIFTSKHLGIPVRDDLDDIRYALAGIGLMTQAFEAMEDLEPIEYYPVDYETLRKAVLISILFTAKEFIHDSVCIQARILPVYADFVELFPVLRSDVGRNVIARKLKRPIAVDTPVFLCRQNKKE